MTFPGGLFARLVRATLDRDGQAVGVEKAASEDTQAAAPGHSRAAPLSTGRRRLPNPDAVLLESAAQKVMHAWLHNRHQTLFPLTINLRRVSPQETELLMRLVAVVLSAVNTVSCARTAQVRDRLGSVGADENQLRVFTGAAQDPPPLGRVLEEAEKQGLGAYAYALSLMALDQRQQVDQLFLEYLAARLALPAGVIRSVNRQYRR
jgi:hypothetical protein